MTTNVARFNSQARFTALLTRIGCNANERSHLIDDGFNTLKQLVASYTYDTPLLKAHFVSLNKAFAGHATTPCYFTPLIIRRLLGIHALFDQSVNTFHQMPNLDAITAAVADELAESYSDSVLEPDDDDKVSNMKLPKLEGSSNWRDFKDKFTLKLSSIKGIQKIPLDYIIDPTDKTRITNQTGVIPNDTIDVYDSEFIHTTATHYGTHYRNDNKRVMQLLKKFLINTPSYNHIITASERHDGRAAFRVLCAY